jgi:hypothetical protein
LKNEATTSRKEFIKLIMEAHNESNYFDFNEELIDKHLKDYENVAHEAVEIGLKLGENEITNHTEFQSQGEKWTILQAVFFASTVCTTIGENFKIPLNSQ